MMIRVFFYTGAAILLCSAALMYLPACFCFILALILIATSLVFLLLRRLNGLRESVAFLLIAAFCLLGINNINENVSPANNLAGYRATVIGTVSDYPTVLPEYTVYELTVDHLRIECKENQKPPRQLPKKLKIRLTDSTGSDLSIFEQAEFFIEFENLNTYRTSNYANGIYAAGSVEQLISTRGENRPFYALFYDFRQLVSAKFYQVLDKDIADFAVALLLGDRQALSDEFNNQVRLTGVSHVLVVSGMHLGVLFQAFGILFLLLRFSGRTSGFLQLLITFAFCAICGFTPSIMRAGLTYGVLALGKILGQKPDPLNSLGFAAMICCFLNPYLFYNVSAMLSFAATFGLLFACPVLMNLVLRPFRGHCPRIVKALLFSLLQTLTATFFTFPITVTYFGYTSLIAPVTNLLIGYAATVTLCLLLASAVFLFLPAFFLPFTNLLLFCSDRLIRYIIAVIQQLSQLKGIVVSTGTDLLLPYSLLLVAVVLLVVFPRLLKHWLRLVCVVLALCFTVSAFSAGAYQVQTRPTLTVQALKLGDGLSVVITTPEVNLIVGAGDGNGDYKTIHSAILKTGRTGANVLLLPHLEKSAAKGAIAFIQHTNIEAVLYPDRGKFYEELSHLAKQPENNLVCYHQYARYTYGKNCTAICLDGTGTVVNLDNTSILILTAAYSLNKLMAYADRPDKILVCAGVLPNNIKNENFSQVIVTCSDKTKEKLLENNLLNKTPVDTKTIYFNNLETQTVKRRTLHADRNPTESRAY